MHQQDSPEKTYPITENQRKAAREFTPDNHLSSLADLTWWDFSKNDKNQLFKLTTKSRKKAYIFCSICHISFESPIYQLFDPKDNHYIGNICPTCMQRKNERNLAKQRQYKTTVIADYPNLLACWEDELSPYTTPISGPTLRNWRCPAGHHVSQTPSSFLERGCSACRALNTKKQNTDAARQQRIPPILDEYPELKEQWHPTKNKKYEYGRIHISMQRIVW